MKRIIKSRIFAFILGAIIFGSVGVIAANYAANTIDYTTSKNSEVKTVKDALDDLYEKHNKNIGKPFYTITSSSTTYTAPKDCILYIYAGWNSSGYAAYVYVNDEELTYYDEQSNEQYIGDKNGKKSHIMYINKGDVISTRSGVSGLTYLLEFYDYE